MASRRAGLVNANRELITRFEQKIQATLARIRGEAEQIPPGLATGVNKVEGKGHFRQSCRHLCSPWLIARHLDIPLGFPHPSPMKTMFQIGLNRPMKTAIMFACLMMESLAFASPPCDKLEVAAPFRTWTIGLSQKEGGWPLYRDGVLICILKKDATTANLKTTSLSLADQRYLKENPPTVKALFDPEIERITLEGDIEELTSSLTAMEAAQRTGTFQTQTKTVSSTDSFLSSVGTQTEGPSHVRIGGASADGLGRRKKTMDLDIQTSQQTNRLCETNSAIENTATIVTSTGSFTDGPSLARIQAVRKVLVERKTKLAALKAAYQMVNGPQGTPGAQTNQPGGF